MITSEFERLMLEGVFRNDFSEIPSGYYMGLCSNGTVTRATTLDEIIEVVGDGYARKLLTRTSEEWGNPVEQPNSYSVSSSVATFTATGVWTGFTRAFLCTVASGTSGKLLAVSEALPAERLLTTGVGFSTTFNIFLR